MCFASPPGADLTPDRLAGVAGVLSSLDAARLYRGKGGELMREAACFLVAKMAVVRLALLEAQHAKVLELVDDNLRHPQVGSLRLLVDWLAFYGFFLAELSTEFCLFACRVDGIWFVSHMLPSVPPTVIAGGHPGGCGCGAVWLHTRLRHQRRAGELGWPVSFWF